MNEKLIENEIISDILKKLAIVHFDYVNHRDEMQKIDIKYIIDTLRESELANMFNWDRVKDASIDEFKQTVTRLDGISDFVSHTYKDEEVANDLTKISNRLKELFVNTENT